MRRTLKFSVNKQIVSPDQNTEDDEGMFLLAVIYTCHYSKTT